MVPARLALFTTQSTRRGDGRFDVTITTTVLYYDGRARDMTLTNFYHLNRCKSLRGFVATRNGRWGNGDCIVARFLRMTR